MKVTVCGNVIRPDEELLSLYLFFSLLSVR